MRIAVVNINDEIIGYKPRNDRSDSDIIRVAGLWLFNERKEVLVARRSLCKVHDPGKWGPSAAGTVEEGETYASNIIKEAKEELGISLREENLIVGPKELRKTSHAYFAQIFFAKLSKDASFTLQKDEVEEVRLVSIDELSDWIKANPDDFIASFRSHPDPKTYFSKYLP